MSLSCAAPHPTPFYRLLKLADAAFADANAPPVRVEEVVTWMGPCLSGECSVSNLGPHKFKKLVL